MPSLNETAKAIIGMPSEVVLPEIPQELDNLQLSNFAIPEEDAMELDWRRNYWDPVSGLLIMADDSGASSHVKTLATKRLKEMFSAYKAKYLPQIVKGQFINQGELDGEYFEHALNDWLIPYSNMIDTRARKHVAGYARWLVWDQKHGTKGFRDHGKNTIIWYRAWLRRVWLLVAFSEASYLFDDVKNELAELAKKELIWATTSRANGMIEKSGWAGRRGVFYGDVDSSKTNGTRVIHTYFLEINHHICQQLLHTEFYGDNKALVDKWIKMTVKTTDKMVEHLLYSVNMYGKKVYPSYVNIRTENVHIDKFETSMPYNKFDPISSGLAPVQLFLSLKTLGELKELIKESSIEWKPGFSFQRNLIVKWTLLSGKQKNVNNAEKSVDHKVNNFDQQADRLQRKLEEAEKKLNDIADILKG